MSIVLYATAILAVIALVSFDAGAGILSALGAIFIIGTADIPD